MDSKDYEQFIKLSIYNHYKVTKIKNSMLYRGLEAKIVKNQDIGNNLYKEPDILDLYSF